MATTWELIASATLPSNQTTYTFSTISQSFTHLKLIACVRETSTSPQAIWATVNGNTGTITGQYLIMDYNALSASNYNTGYIGSALGTAATSGFFSQHETTFGNYKSNTTKAWWSRNSAGSNSTGTASSYMNWIAQQQTDNNPITSINITPSAGDLLAGSKFWLYGLKIA